MIKNKKVTVKQLMKAAAVLMRFLDEYQTVNLQNSDAIVEYERKVQSVTSILAIKRYDGLNTYSLLDLLNEEARIHTCPIDGHQMVCIDHDFVLGDDDRVDFVQDHVCRPVCAECAG